MVERSIQSNGATQIHDYLLDIDNLLNQLRVKLNKRNPSNFNPKFARSIELMLTRHDPALFIDNSYPTAIEFLEHALHQESTPDRNDLLIIGLYKLFEEHYQRNTGFIATAFHYDIQALKKIHRQLQVIFWKIKTAKDKNDRFLFLTWQNNWQIALHKRLVLEKRPFSTELFQTLPTIHTNEETLFDASNTSFTDIFAKILYIVEKTITIRGGEFEVLSAATLKRLIMLPLGGI
jgi:hypothetical protein